MNRLKKQLSIVLAVMMVIGVFMTVPFTVSAAEKDTINFTSNVCDTVSVDYDSNDKQVAVTYFLQSEKMIINTQAVITYDSKVLKVAEGANADTTCMPIFSNGSSMSNFNLKDAIKFNATSLNLYNFKNKGVYFTLTFDIIGSGDTNVDLNVEVLTGLSADNFFEDEDAYDIDFIFYDEKMPNGYSFETSAEITKSEEPPIVDGTTLKFIVPKTVTSPKCWNDGVYLAYSDDYNLDSFTKLPLTKTTQYLTPDLKTDKLTEGTYAMYSITLSKEQVAAIEKATYVALINNGNDYRTYINGKYNILRAPVGSYSDTYNTSKTSVADLENYTFIMNDQVETGTSIEGFGTYSGYWTKCTDIQVVVPSSSIWKNCWNKGVYLAYSNDYTLDSFTKIKMTRTSTYIDVDSQTTQLVGGAYPVYTVSLTEDEVAAIDASTYVIFMNSGNDYRTYINGKYNVMRAATDTYAETYNTTKAKVADRANNTFVLCGGLATGTSIEGYGTFTGYWLTKELELVESTATLYCVFPAPTKAKKAMDDGVYLAYGNSSAPADLTFIEMDKTDKTYTPDLKTSSLVAGEYPVYEITLTSDQIEGINSSKNVIFCNKTGNARTLLANPYNVLLAQSDNFSATYSTAKFVTEDHNGETFVVCGAKTTGTSTDGYGNFLGYWDLGKES